MRVLAYASLAAVAGAVAGCTPFDSAPAAAIPDQCEAQVYADPHVKDLLMKSAGSESFARQHDEELRYAKIDAAHRCLQLKGLSPPGGGVERRTVRD